MKIWIDAQFSPTLASWIAATFGVEATAVRDLELSQVEDPVIFEAAKQANAVVTTKDRDFVELLQRFGAPPPVILVTAGNTSNARMRAILSATLPTALELLRAGEPLIELSDLGVKGAS